MLKDPESAKYQDVTVRKRLGSTVYCGEVNAKNGFGGYVGWRSFMIVSGGIAGSGGVEIQSISNDGKFRATWHLLCYLSDLDEKRSLPKKVKLHDHA